MGPAFKQGWEAHKAQQLTTSNPYAEGTWSHKDWVDGWKAYGAYLRGRVLAAQVRRASRSPFVHG